MLGKIYEDEIDAYKSACLAACKELYNLGQLDDCFIPVGTKEIIEKCNLVNHAFHESELKEHDFLFNNKLKRERLFFKKKINDAEFFKTLCHPNKFSLYQIEFDTEDRCLSEGRSLGLLTELQLNEQCTSTIIYSSQYQCNVKLNLIKRNIKLNEDQFSKISEFTKIIFVSTIARLKRRQDKVKFDPNECLFKFVYLDDNVVDFDEMDELVDSFEKGKSKFDDTCLNKLVKAIHTNTDYKIISLETGMYPNSEFYYHHSKKTFNKYFEEKYDKIIENQDEQLVQVEPADLKSMYSIYVKPDSSAKENRTYKYGAYLPKEFLVIAAYDKADYKKFCALAPLIYRLKQKLILKCFQSSLMKEIIGYSDQSDIKLENVLNSPNKEYVSNFDEYLNEIHQRKKKKNSNIDELDRDSDSTEDEISSSEEISDEDDKISQIDEQIKNELTKSTSTQKNDIVKVVFPSEEVLNYSINRKIYDDILVSKLLKNLNSNNYRSPDEFQKSLYEEFKEIIVNLSLNCGLKNFEDIEPKLKKRKMDNSEEIAKHDFNFWKNENSDRFIISIATLLEALTARSCQDVVSLERLEFLGDAFLKLVTCSLLFHNYPKGELGDLNILKASAVSNKKLYGLSREKQLSQYIFSDDFNVGFKWLPDGFR